jgi:hypothetical protein
MIVKDVTYLLVEADFKQGEVVDRNTPYDGVTKSTAFLSDPMNYFLELDWDFASDNNIWAQTMSSGKPIFQWLYDRGDYALIDGHTISTAVRQTQLKPGNMQLNGRTLTINSESKIDELRVYSLTGQLHYHTTSVNAISANVELATDGVFVISVLSDKIWSSAKLIIK